jgi:hypothetical protein
VTDDTTGTGLPDDRTGPDTPGPEATPEQEAYAAGLLASLRADDPEIPDYVAARIDGVLAEMRRTEPITAGAAAALVDSDDSDDATAGTPSTGLGGDATVLPLPTARRESGTTRTFRWVAGAAAAVIVVAGGAAVIRGVSGAGSSTSGTALSAGDASNGGRDPAPIRSSGTSYTRAELASQATALVASASKGEQPEVAPATPEPAQSEGTGQQPGARTLLSNDTLAACLEQLTGAPGTTPVAVDQGTYEGKPADIVVLRSPDDPERLEVWVIGPGCTRESVTMYEFRTIPVPGSDGTGGPQSDAPAPGATASSEPSTEPSSPTP